MGLEAGSEGVHVRMDIGDDGRPHGVDGWGRRASGVNGGDGREERPVPR